MYDIINIKFLLLIVIIIFIFRHRKKLYLHQLLQVENYENHSILNNNIMNFTKEIVSPKLYSFERDILQYIPKIYSNFRYSLEFKLGLEITKNFDIENLESPGLSNNLKILEQNSRDLFMCSETEYYHMLDEKTEFQNEFGFICGLYYQHLLFFISPKVNIESILDLKIYMNNENLYTDKKKKDKTKIIKVGIPNKNTNSYFDAIKIFNSIGIDINKKYSNLQFVFDTEKKLISRIKPTVIPDKKIDCFYMSTSEKHPYILEFLQSYNLNVVTTESINPNIIKSNFGGNYLFKNRISKNNFSRIIKKKNIYQDIPKYTLSSRLINNEAETLIIGGSYLNVFSSRVVIVASNKVSVQYVNNFLKSLYGNIDQIRNKLQQYLFYKSQKNILPRCLEPHEMSYINSRFSYHPGAYKFFQEVDFISDINSIKYNIFNEN